MSSWEGHSRKVSRREEKELTCRSPGKNEQQIAYPQSIVRTHLVVLTFHSLSVP